MPKLCDILLVRRAVVNTLPRTHERSMRPTLLACLFTCLVPSAAAAVVDAGSDALPTTGYHTYAKGRHVGLPRRGILGWRKGCLDVAVANCRRSGTCHLLDLYEFGVFTGRALKGMASYLRAPPGGGPAVPIDTMWGFDSFQGIPSEESDSAACDRHVACERFVQVMQPFYDGALPQLEELTRATSAMGEAQGKMKTFFSEESKASVDEAYSRWASFLNQLDQAAANINDDRRKAEARKAK